MLINYNVAIHFFFVNFFFLLYINMSKTTKKLREILWDKKNYGKKWKNIWISQRSNNYYIYGVGIGAILAIGACVFFTYNKKSSQVENKKQVKKELQKPTKRPKQRNKI